jgi:hypothetical protein
MKKTSGYFHLALNLHLMNIGEECDLIMGLDYATNTQIVNVPLSQSALQALATTVRGDLGSRVTDPHPTLTKLEQQHVDAMTRALLGVTSDIVRQANNIALGNRTVFETLLRGIGLHPAQLKAKHPRIFATKSTAKGTIEVLVPVEKGLGKPIYYYEYGITTAEHVLPATWEKPIPLPVTEFFLSGIPSGSIVAVHYAVLVVPPHRAKTSTTAASSSKSILPPATPNKMVTVLPVNAKGKISLVHRTAFFTFSDVIYVIVS